MAYLCHQCETAYTSRPEDRSGCHGTEECHRGSRQSLAYYPNMSRAEVERRLKWGTLYDEVKST